ncbi:MAG: hypothetical protein JW828_08055, partial [Sedimentisphaerales bacterium]|nr:hypothetical protein [Sedimentisphaerales bacterium]
SSVLARWLDFGQAGLSSLPTSALLGALINTLLFCISDDGQDLCAVLPDGFWLPHDIEFGQTFR